MTKRSPALRGYALCGEPRAGTTFLKQVLCSTGLLGEPVEWFDPRWTREAGSADRDFLDAMLARTSSPNGVYGLKIFASHSATAERYRWITRLPNLSFVHVRREDLLGQAISLVRASQTARFVSDEQERRAPAYDRRAITITMQAIARGQARWELWFAVNGITPLELGYESLMADPDAAVAGIARLVGVEGAAIDWTRVSAGVMRDGLNEEWKQRYLAEAASPDAVPEIEDLSLRGILRSIGRALR